MNSVAAAALALFGATFEFALNRLAARYCVSQTVAKLAAAATAARSEQHGRRSRSSNVA